MCKLRNHSYKFRNRRSWKALLFEQIRVQKAMPYMSHLDIAVRWSSTYKMIEIALELQRPIVAACHLQDLDESTMDIELTSAD